MSHYYMPLDAKLKALEHAEAKMAGGSGQRSYWRRVALKLAAEIYEMRAAGKTEWRHDI